MEQQTADVVFEAGMMQLDTGACIRNNVKIMPLARELFTRIPLLQVIRFQPADQAESTYLTQQGVPMQLDPPNGHDGEAQAKANAAMAVAPSFYFVLTRYFALTEPKLCGTV